MKFDDVATLYDRTFTHTRIGQMQREMVHNYLDAIIRDDRTGKVLELNAGTGEDAIWFARKGWDVLATDVSPQMIRVAGEKASGESVNGNIEFRVCDITRLNQLQTDDKFDLVFSNFGGLNCLSLAEIETLSYNISALLKPGGRFIAVVMPKFCLWESMYFLLKGDMKSVFRRNTSRSIPVPVGDDQVETWYHSPAEFAARFRMFFKKAAWRPVGVAVPPSYMEPFFVKRPGLLSFFNKFDKMLRDIPVFAFFSDHFLIELQLSS